jgi:signal transduction histidine kinase
MPAPIRARLLLLMMTVLLPAIAGALFLVARTYHDERETLAASLRDSALAMAQVIDRELAHRMDIAEILAASPLLSRNPEIDPDLSYLHHWTSRIVDNVGGSIELHSATHLLMDSRGAPGAPPRPHGTAGFQLSRVPLVVPLAVTASGEVTPPQLVQPVHRVGGELLNLVITLPPEVMQRMVDHQSLPPDWVGTVLDNGQRVVARHPGGTAYIGWLATDDIRAGLDAAAEAPFTSVTFDGKPAVGHFSRTPQGWAYVTAAPREVLIADLPLPVLHVTAGALMLLGLAAGASLWVGRGIAAAAESLKRAAQSLQAGGPIARQQPTGIAEFDAVGQAMAVSAQALADSRHELERQVDEAVARTRLAEQRVSQGQRIAALGRLTGGVAHDFNNLLGVISNSAHLIGRHAAQNPALQMPVDVTRRAVEMGSHLSQQLLRFSGRQPVSPRPVDLGVCLPELSEMLALVARKNVQVSIAVDPGTAQVKVDPSELELALINMALNARDAMPNGGRLNIDARNAGANEADGLPAGDYVLVSVSDNGVGMPEEQAAQAFEPFFTTKAVGKGTGLGLSQVHGFCVQAGGTAHMVSTPGLGTTVTMVLPACTAAAATEADAAPAEAEAEDRSAVMAGVTVLLVEDNDELADVTVLLLQSYGCKVRRALDVDDALAQLDADGSVQLVLTDVVMPGTRNGVDLARELTRTRPSLPVVLISGYSAALNGLTGFTVLRKPVAPQVLVRALVGALRNRTPPAEAGSA